MEPVPAEVVATGATVPLVQGVTAIEPVKAVKPSKPVQPVEQALEQKPVELARVDAAQTVEPAKPVTQEQEVLRALEDPLAAVTQSPRAKPKPPVRKTEPQKAPEGKARTAQAKGAEASSRKGGERVTSRTAHSNANGRANAKSKDGGTKAASNYKGKVVAKLRRAKRYPPQARRKSLEGTARVAFTISRDGSVSGIRLAGSSGHALLDQAALDMVRRAAPMPKFPGDIAGPRMSLQVPVRFSR
nr:energy transducer TonB [Roseibium sp. CAU 1639]